MHFCLNEWVALLWARSSYSFDIDLALKWKRIKNKIIGVNTPIVQELWKLGHITIMLAAAWGELQHSHCCPAWKGTSPCMRTVQAQFPHFQADCTHRLAEIPVLDQWKVFLVNKLGFQKVKWSLKAMPVPSKKMSFLLLSQHTFMSFSSGSKIQ